MARHIDFKGGSPPRLAINVDVTVILFHNAVDRGQSQSGSLSNVLGRKKRFKDSGLRFLVHTAAVVTDGQKRIVSRNGALVIIAVFHIKNRDSRFAGYFAYT